MKENREENRTGATTVNVASKKRYSDVELEEFRQIILEKLKKAHEDLDLLLEGFKGNDHSTKETGTKINLKVMEQDESDSREENSMLAGRQQRFISSLENALIRIKNGTYGICRVSGNLISKERLRSVPHATLSIEAKLAQNKVDGLPRSIRN